MDHRVPGHQVPHRHSVEHLPGLRDLGARDVRSEHDVAEEHVAQGRLVEGVPREVDAPRLGVHLDERGADEEVGGGEPRPERARVERGADGHGRRRGPARLERDGEREGGGEEPRRAREEPGEEAEGLQREARAEVGAHHAGGVEHVRPRRLLEARVHCLLLRQRRRRRRRRS
ncbi:Os07g0637050, partial [Oryza sativa Japonica Group]